MLGTEVVIYQAVEQLLLWTERSVEKMPLREAGLVFRDAAK